MELLGTMFLVYYGGMAIVTAHYEKIKDDSTKESTYPKAWPISGDELYGIALAHGLILGIYIYAGASSGCNCHFNPAVTVGMLL